MKIMSRMVVGVVLVAMVAGVAMAQFAKPEDAINYRQSVMSVLVQHFKQMGAMVQGKAAFDREAFATDADVVKMLSTLPWDAFLVPGTDAGDSDMSAAVFEKKETFLKMSLSFQDNTALLASAAQDADLDGLKAPFNTVAQDCKSCHEAFRK